MNDIVEFLTSEHYTVFPRDLNNLITQSFSGYTVLFM